MIIVHLYSFISKLATTGEVYIPLCMEKIIRYVYLCPCANCVQLLGHTLAAGKTLQGCCYCCTNKKVNNPVQLTCNGLELSTFPSARGHSLIFEHTRIESAKTDFIAHTVLYLLTRTLLRTQTTCIDHQWAKEKQPAEADHTRLLYFSSETL